jgi:hypothetical protein
MHLAGSLIAKMKDFHAERRQDVGDDPAMTAPPEHLSAHDCGAKAVGQHEQVVQPFGKLLRGGVIGVGAECRMPPACIDGSLIRSTSAAERGNPLIIDVALREVACEDVTGEVGKAPRTGKASHVRHELNVVRREHVAKLIARSRGVADRPNAQGHTRTITTGETRRPRCDLSNSSAETQ